MSYAIFLACKECSREYPLVSLYVCDFCFGPLEVKYDYASAKSAFHKRAIADGPPNIWRYSALLPVDAKYKVDNGTGMTPLTKAERLGERLGLKNLWIKNDAANPTHSFKDRVVSIACAKARELGMDTLACASTGNLAGATAAIGAKAGMKTLVFMPSDLEQGKIIGASVYGSVVLVKGNYDDVNRLCCELSASRDWAFANINMRPYYSEGSKTLAFEIAEQLGWRLPDNIVIPVGSGSLFTKIWKGLNELHEMGLVPEVKTRLHIAQPEGCSPVAKAFLNGESYPRPVVPNTVAKSLAIGSPADGFYTVQTAKKSGGGAAIVQEERVSSGIRKLAESEGIFTETAGGVVVSALEQLVIEGIIKPDEETVALITGSGFKTLEAVASSKGIFEVEPTVESVEKTILETITHDEKLALSVY